MSRALQFLALLAVVIGCLAYGVWRGPADAHGVLYVAVLVAFLLSDTRYWLAGSVASKPASPPVSSSTTTTR